MLIFSSPPFPKLWFFLIHLIFLFQDQIFFKLCQLFLWKLILFLFKCCYQPPQILFLFLALNCYTYLYDCSNRLVFFSHQVEPLDGGQHLIALKANPILPFSRTKRHAGIHFVSLLPPLTIYSTDLFCTIASSDNFAPAIKT